jgi:hypothetical protein
MKPRQLATILAAVALTISGVGVVLVSRDAAPSRPEVRDHDAADEAIEQLLRMDARFKAGISLMAYSEGLADVLFAVDAFEASGEATQMPGVADAISAARAHYQWVARVWPMKIGTQGRAVWEVPDDEDAARYFGSTPEASIAAAQEVREWALARGSEYGPDLEGYIDQLVARVFARAGDLGRDARRDLKALKTGD